MAIPAHAADWEAAPPTGLGTALHELFKSLDDVGLELLPREPMREPPRLDRPTSE